MLGLPYVLVYRAFNLFFFSRCTARAFTVGEVRWQRMKASKQNYIQCYGQVPTENGYHNGSRFHT